MVDLIIGIESWGAKRFPPLVNVCLNGWTLGNNVQHFERPLVRKAQNAVIYYSIVLNQPEDWKAPFLLTSMAVKMQFFTHISGVCTQESDNNDLLMLLYCHNSKHTKKKQTKYIYHRGNADMKRKKNEYPTPITRSPYSFNLYTKNESITVHDWKIM